MSAERDSWSAAGHLRRLGDPIVDTSSMIAFALDDGRQIALQKDTDPNRLWVEHDARCGFPPAVVLRKYDQASGRHRDLPSRLGHHPGSQRNARHVMVLSVTGAKMLDSVLAWYGVTPETASKASGSPEQSAGETDNRPIVGVRESELRADERPSVTGQDRKDMGPDASAEVSANPTLGSIVAASGASVRLTNCVNRSFLATLTVADAISDMAAFERRCTTVPAMGRKSILELRRLIDRHQNSPGADICIDSDVGGLHDIRETMDMLTQLFSQIRLGEVCETFGASQRLSNVMSSSSLRDLTMSELFLDWDGHCRNLAGLRNFGRKSQTELAAICTQLAEGLLKTGGISDIDAKDLAAALLGSVSLGHDRLSSLRELIEALDEFSIHDLVSRDERSADDLLENIFAELDARSREIIRRRFGLGGGGRFTLEEIALDYGVTRERVRQIEVKAIRTMERVARLLPIEQKLLESLQTVLDGPAGRKGYVTRQDLDGGEAVSAEMQLFMAVAGLQLEELLGRIATPWGAGWYSRELDTQVLEQVAEMLELAFREMAFPRPLASLIDHDVRDTVQMVLELRLGRVLHDGYVLGPGNLRAQVRVADLHRLLCSGGMPCGSLELADRLACLYRQTPRSSRYIVIIMRRHPHLFLEGDDDSWFAVAPSPTEKADIIVADEPAHRDAPHGAENQTLADLLREILRQQGPLPLSELMALVGDVADRASSTGPTLLTHREIFARVLPGVYGLRDALPTPEDVNLRPPAVLLNENQARLFALARRAGEPWGAFPLWVPASEHALCSWSSEHAGEELFQSLLSVASVETWPIGEFERAFWRECVNEAGGRFHLHFEPKEEVGYRLPALDRVLAACLVTSANGQFNWMVANRILNRPVASHQSAGFMALLCSLGAISAGPEQQWQRAHDAGPELAALIEDLSRELHLRGVLEWESSLGQCVLDSAASTIEAPRYWVDRRLLADMLQSGKTGNSSDEPLIERAVVAELEALAWEEDVIPTATAIDAESAIPSDYRAMTVEAARILSDDEDEWSVDDIIDD